MRVMWEREKYGVSSAFGACVYHGGDVRRNMLNVHHSLPPLGHRGPSVAAFTGLKKEIHPLLLELVLERWLYWRIIEDACAEHPLWMGTVKHYRNIYNLAPLKLILTHQKL